MSEDQSKNDYRPKYYDLLSPSDQEQYTELRSTLSSQMCRNRRGKRLEGFSDMLSSIRAFCIRHNDDDWKRCLVCGVCWLPNGIAINNRQLSILIDKCKSSINGSLQKMGYSTLQSRSESSSSLCDTIPLLKNNFNELREWTVRLFVAATPQPNLPIYSVNTLHPFQSPMPSQYQAFSIQPQVYFPVVPMAMPVPQMAGQPILPIPGQPVLPIPGQPILPIPGQPILPLPGQPVLPIPGQAVLPIPGQPMLPIAGQPVLPISGQPDPNSFFDDEFALPPTFLTDDAVAPPIQPPPPAAPPGNEGGGDLDLIDAADPIPFQDDQFGLFGDKW
jgi:hypothetical protein